LAPLGRSATLPAPPECFSKWAKVFAASRSSAEKNWSAAAWEFFAGAVAEGGVMRVVGRRGRRRGRSGRRVAAAAAAAAAATERRRRTGVAAAADGAPPRLLLPSSARQGDEWPSRTERELIVLGLDWIGIGESARAKRGEGSLSFFFCDREEAIRCRARGGNARDVKRADDGLVDV
jgi:hypothetical protein